MKGKHLSLIIALFFTVNISHSQCCLEVQLPDDERYDYLRKADRFLQKENIKKAKKAINKYVYSDVYLTLITAKLNYVEGFNQIAIDSLTVALNKQISVDQKTLTLILLGDISLFSRDTLLAISSYKKVLETDSLNKVGYNRLLVSMKLSKINSSEIYKLSKRAYANTDSTDYLLWMADEKLFQRDLIKSNKYLAEYESIEFIRGYKYYLIKGKQLYNMYFVDKEKNIELLKESKRNIELALKMRGYLPFEYEEAISLLNLLEETIR